ncbi:uncharacterized protein LOC134409950 isoform X2 [Elgaria multicarinata webbii]|uniref:uncharacterized protein LOC134409950 isoform X2 n=2 Tax=Elgaria multicarinata webbii TaxID=159646 RepID=UPI002FCCEDC7
MRKDCDLEPAVRGIMDILEGRLGRKCTLHESEGISQMELVLKAIGNAGLAAAPLSPVLTSCASLKSNPAEIRLAAIEAFRRIPCAANHAVLVRLYQTFDEDVEIRIASYLMSMKCPSEELFRQVKWTLQEEKSSQVGSFVWSHLSEILGTDDPLKQHLRNSLPDDILNKEFDWETWKFSSYSDVTIHSAKASMNTEAKVIFSPASFIPRLTAANLTVHLLGRAVNLLEVGVRLENVEDVVQKFFGFHPVQDTTKRYSKPEPPVETTRKTQLNKPTSMRFSRRNDLPPKESKPRLRKEKQSCPREQYNKMSELVKKFTKRMGKKKKPKCGLSVKIFGNELAVLDCGDLRNQAKLYYLNLAELVVKLLKGQDLHLNKRLSLATEELLFPALSGLPVRLALNASAAVNVTIRGNVDFRQRNNFFVNGYIKPSAILHISAQMGTAGTLGKTGLSWSTGLRSATSLDGGIQVKKGKEFKVFLNTPEDSMEIVNFSSKLYIRTANETAAVDIFPDHVETKSCTNEDVSKAFGWQLCSEVSNPVNDSAGFIFPFLGPGKVAITLKKQDRNLQQYLLKAAYNYNSQKGSWIPNEAGLHFFMGTPKSELKRDVAVDVHVNIPQKKFGIEFIQPKKKIQMNGKIEASRNSRVGRLELILDDDNIYYIKGKTDLQLGSGEQKHTIHLEAKLLKRGSPLVLSGNITKQAGKKMAFSISLVNLLKDTAFLAMCLEKKADDKFKQYSLEGETHVPGVLGSHVLSLLQQRGYFWTHALRIKYGLFGDARNLQHECNMGQKLKVENSLQDAYRADLEHEFHCTQILAYNHKVHLHHEETPSRLQSQLEMNYGKHWDEINNRKRVVVSQTFKNNSYPTLTSYFMEFAVQVPEKRVDYRTQLQHSHTSQSYRESSTHFKVHYNNHMPFVAGLQWKDTSRHPLKKWEGIFNMDTPWLYLYVAHRLHQPQHSVYLAAVDLTAGKAFVVKGLSMELFCKDKDGEKEGRVRIHTPTTTYLRASTVNCFKQGFLHSQSEVVSLWNQPVKNEIHLENHEQAKRVHLTIKSAKQEFNMTAAYFHLETPQKTNVSMWVLWTDHKSLPLVLQLEAQIEEVRKEKMLYQKRGTIQFRHPFKLPIPQSFLLQETFTVNKKEKHYFLETKVLINGLEESVQTLTLSYQAENPYICAGLAHPYNSKIFPPNIEVCTVIRTLSRAKREVEVNLKMDEKEVLSFLGKYHNKSNMAASQHLVQTDMTHSFQLQFPQSISVNGELFSSETKPIDFAWGLTAKATINQQDVSEFSAWLNGSDAGFGITSQLFHLNHSNFPPSFQVRITTSRYGGDNLNGSFYLHSGGKDLVLLEADFNREMRKNARAIRVSTVLKQAIVTRLKYVWLHFMGKMSPSRLILSSAMKLNENSFHLGITGSKEQKKGLGLTLHGSIEHNLESLMYIIPQDLSLDSSLKRKNNVHEGVVRVMVNQSVYGMHIRNRNVFGDESFHNITVAVTQNGSHAFPREAKIKGRLELKRGIQKGAASLQIDTRAFSIDISNIILQEQIGVAGTLVHNISALYMAGLPVENSITAMYGHIESNHTVTLRLQGGDGRIMASFELEKLPLEPFRAQLTTSLSHNLAGLKRHGVPFTSEGMCFYQNFSQKLAVGATVQAGEEEFQVELENRGTDSTAGFSLFFHHNVGLLHIIPPIVQVQCDGESTSHQLSGHCNGEVASHSLETLASILLNGSVHASNGAANLIGEVVSNGTWAEFQLHAACSPEHIVEISLRHLWPGLGSLGLAQENRIKVTAVKGEEYKGLLEVALGECMLRGNGELSTEGEAAESEWRVILLNKCDILENLDIPQNLVSGGSFLKNANNVSLTSYFRCDGQGVDVQLEMCSVDKYTLQGTLTHTVAYLHDLGLPSENSIVLSMTNESSVLKGVLSLHVGNCNVKAQGEIQPQDRIEWTLEMKNDCQSLQDLGIPTKMDGLGHILTSKMNLDSHVMFTMGEKTLHGLLILKVMDIRQELHALLAHNIKGAILLGIPERTVVDLISEKDGVVRKRLLRFSVDGKQITEELSFTQKSDHVSLEYKLAHNLEILQALWIQDRIELQVTAMLLAIKNLTLKFHYGSYWIVLGGQLQMAGVRMDFTGNMHHKWPWLLQSHIPEVIQLTLLEILSENKTEASLKLACDPDLNLLFIFATKNKLKSEELHIKSLQNLPFLLPYFPNVAEVSTKVNYATKEAEGKISIQKENKNLLVLTKLTFTGTNHTQVLQLMHTIPQLTILPGQFVLTTAYQKSKRIQVLSGIALWDGKEAKVTGTYTGLFPKMSGGHDMKVEICHPLLLPFPQHSTLSIYVEHSARTHRDDIVIGWDTMEQVSVSSSLKLGKERASYSAALVHPFNFTVKHVEVSSLAESRRGAYSRQMQLAWNNGQPAHLKLTFGDKSKANATLWDACIAASSGQLQNILTVANVQACGSLEQTAALFNQRLDLKWDGKKVTQNLTYEKSKPSQRDKIQVEAILENALLTSCSGQHFLGKVETDYSTRLYHFVSLGVCSLPSAMELSGKHQLNQGGVLLRSEGKLTLAGVDSSIVVALKNHSQAGVKNYSTEFLLKASDILWLDVMGTVTSSAGQSQILVEGILDPKEKVKFAASKGKGCLRYYVGYLKGNSEEGLEATVCTEGQQHAALHAHLLINEERVEEMGRLALEASNQSVSLKAHGCGHPVVKIESKLMEIASDLQHRLLAKLKKLEEHLQDFKKSASSWHNEFSQA